MRALFPAPAAAGDGIGGSGAALRALQRLQAWLQRRAPPAFPGGEVTLAAAAAGAAGGAALEPRPILVVGLPRSGATLVQQALLR
jgi:hypothetical protein